MKQVRLSLFSDKLFTSEPVFQKIAFTLPQITITKIHIFMFSKYIE